MEMIPVPKPYVAAFERLGFGMFIHWGLYSQLSQGEWTKKIHEIPDDEYRKLKDTFTAEDFNPREIAKLAKSAGMKYIVLTTRHHEGFSLYDTRGLNEYDAVHSPAKRDLIGEYVEGCRAEGIIPFFYHTTADWDNELYKTDFHAYQKYLQKSIEILCTNYGEIGGFWFDGNWDKPFEDWEEDTLYGIIRKYQPNAIIVNNSGLHKQGEYGHPEIDSVTFEQGRPSPLDRKGKNKYVAGEMCETMGAFWGYSNNDYNFKSTKQLIETLCACRKVGANYLLNIGLTGTGAIDYLQAATLKKIGEWVKVNGSAIYNVTPAEVYGVGSDFAIHGDDGKLYFFIHKLGMKGHSNVTVSDGGIGPRTFTGIKGKIKSIKWLDSDEEMSFTQNSEADLFSFFATGYSYGKDYVVRVAVADLE